MWLGAVAQPAASGCEQGVAAQQHGIGAGRFGVIGQVPERVSGYRDDLEFGADAGDAQRLAVARGVTALRDRLVGRTPDRQRAPGAQLGDAVDVIVVVVGD